MNKKSTFFAGLALIIIVIVVGVVLSKKPAPSESPEIQDASAVSSNATAVEQVTPDETPTEVAGNIPQENIPEETPAVEIPQPNDSLSKEEATTHVAKFVTNYGEFTVDLFGGWTPVTVASFVNLASQNFYDGIKFHRIIDGFMIQGGDPNSKDDSNPGSWGTGGPGYTFETEFSVNSKNLTGTISMANSGGTGTNGSQFFINVADNTNLDTMVNGQAKNCAIRGVSCHTAFGEVSSGMDVVQAISKVETASGNRPVEPVVMESVTISQK